MEQTSAQCPECRGLGWVKPDVADPADPRFGRFVPCPGCGDAVRELRELRVMELLQEHIVRYTAFRGSLRECMFEDFDIASDERVVAAYNARMFAIRVIRFVQGEIPWVYLFNRLIAQRRAVLFTTAPELLAMIREGFDGGQASS